MRSLRARGRRRRREPAPDERTYPVWAFVAGFVGLALVGLLCLLMLGSGGGTELLQTPQTFPGSAAPEVTDAPVAGTSAPEQGPTSVATTSSAPEAPEPRQDPPGSTGVPTGVAFPDGTPAPEGATSVLVAEGSTSITFAPPPDARIPEGADITSLPGYSAAVPPTSVIPSAGGSSLEVRVACGRSDDEFLAQLVVIESEANVTVTAVVLVPDGGPPCTLGRARVVTVPLVSPLAGRPLVVVPPGTDLTRSGGG